MHPPLFVYAPLREDIKLLLVTHLSTVAESADDAAVMKQNSFLWYVIVDVCQLHTAILQLMDKILQRWASFPRKVIIGHPSSKMKEYRRPAKLQYERSKQKHSYECTVYDFLRSLRKEFAHLHTEADKISRLGRRGAKVIRRDVP